MKAINKIKQVLNSVPKRAAAICGLVAVVMVPLAIYAWGPSRETFTIEKPATYVTFNSITNNPNYGDERNFLRVRDADSKYWSSTSTNGWTDTMTMTEGHTYDVKLYVHNNAAANLGLKSTNTRAFVNLPIKDDTYGKQFEINGFIMSDNAKPGKIWDNIVLKSDKAFHVKVVSQKYINNIKTEAKGGFDLGNEVYMGDGTGAKLGYESLDGIIPGCYQYSGYVLLKVQPVFQIVPAPAYDIEKTVDKTSAKPGDTINYTINVKNTGNVNLTNVKVSDKLPAYYSEAKETVNSQNGSNGSIVKDGQITFNKLNVGETATIKISYTIKSADQLECGDTKIVNKVSGTTDQDQTEDNDDNNEVTTTVTNECEYGYDLIKTVDKSSANVGDTLTYTLTIKNTGRLDVTNVVVKDTLPSGVTLAGDIQTKPEVKVSGDITKEGLKIDKIEAGKQVQIILTAKISVEIDQLACGDNQFVNKATATTDQDQTEDRTDNNSATTTVNRVCTIIPPEEPEDPTPEEPAQPTPETPTVIAQTGAGETITTVIALGALAAAITAYIRSRELVKK